MTLTTLRFPDGNRNGPVEIIDEAQDLTAEWAALGDEIDFRGVDEVALYLTLDINSSVNVRVRFLAAHTSGGQGHVLPLPTTGASDIKLEDRLQEFNDDENQSMVPTWTLNGVILFGQFQVMAGTVGGTAGQIDAANVVTVMRD
jgi:hypothetical protein